MLELKNITKTFTRGSKVYPALSDVSARIEKGNFCMVLGSSGAGKSTLLYIAGGLIHPDSGEMLFKSKDIYSQPEPELNSYRKKHLGFMFQQFYLMPYLDVTDNIRLACPEDKHHEKIGFYLQKCSLTAMKNKYPSELSVGEKQRVAFIRAIISEPEILLADEPTGNLDPVNSEILLSLISDYNSAGGTVVLVTHDPGMTRYANQVISLERGMVKS